MEKREKFSSGLTVFFATLSSAVGLGNIWLFPYLIGQNGGAAFIFTYLLCVVIIGFPIMISEFIIGRSTRKNVMGAVKKITNKKIFKAYGYISIISSYLILAFYTVVVGWVYLYFFKALFGQLAVTDKSNAIEVFNNVTVDAVSPILWQITVIVIVSIILISGVKQGIEKITKIFMPIFLLLLIICVIKSLTLSGNVSGIKYVFMPNFSQLTLSSVIIALGLAFFKLSLGTGTMITYSSYFTDDNNLVSTATKVILSDTGVSLLAGLAIFPAVFTFGLEPTSGPGLLFQTIPLIFANMKGGYILLVIFFLLTAFAATMAVISMFEVSIAYFIEEKGFGRSKAVIINAVIVIALGTLPALSANKDSVLGVIKVFNMNFFDLFQYVYSNIMLPIAGLFVVILVGYIMNTKVIKTQLSYNSDKFIKSYNFILKYITPAFLIIIFLTSLGIIKG